MMMRRNKKKGGRFLKMLFIYIIRLYSMHLMRPLTKKDPSEYGGNPSLGKK
jgi:hypothetical protein